MGATDSELVDRSRRGDVGSFARLAARWDGKAYALAYRLTQDATSAEDIKQTALLRAYERLGEFNGRAAFSTWLFRIVVNLCRDRHRSTAVRQKALGRSPGAGRRDQSFAPRADAASQKRETAGRVAEAVRSLPAGIREVVVMRHYMELKFAEIAEVLDAPVSTVKTRMARGLTLLRESLEDVRS